VGADGSWAVSTANVAADRVGSAAAF